MIRRSTLQGALKMTDIRNYESDEGVQETESDGETWEEDVESKGTTPTKKGKAKRNR